MPFTDLKFHYGKAKGNQYFLSPATFGKSDPFVEAADELASIGDKESWKISRKLLPSQRTFVPIIVRGEEAEGVKMWGFGSTVYEEILKLISDPDYGDITNTETGTDLIVEKKSGASVGNNYGKISIRPKRKASMLSEDTALIEKWLTDQPNLNEIYPETTYEKLEEVLKNYLDPDNDESRAVSSVDNSVKSSIESSKGIDTDAMLDEFKNMLSKDN